MLIQEALKQAISQLHKADIEESSLKARLLLANIVGCRKEQLIIRENERLEEEKEKSYVKQIEELIQGKPLQYMTHEQEFMKMKFYVDEAVLIPRPDTEILVEEVINSCQEEHETWDILDMCTGSGAIGISLASFIAKSKVTVVDVSIPALVVAEKNVLKNGVKQQVQLCLSDMFEKVEGRFDRIVSNPPYIRQEVIQQLDQEVKREPILALDGGEDGLYFYRILAKEAYAYLKEEGILLLEIGYDQKEQVVTLLEETGYYQEIRVKQDLAKRDRVVIAKRRG